MHAPRSVLYPFICQVAIALLVTACAAGPSTNLAALYRAQTVNPDQPPVILVPGAFGSRLHYVSDGKEAWPGSLRQIFFSDYRYLRYEIDPVSLKPAPPSIVVGDIADRALGIDYYGRILSTLEQFGGFQRAIPGTPAEQGQRRYYVLTYDWRQDNVQSARALDALIQQIRMDYRNPDLKVDVIAHSMGGMIVRYFARYGTSDVLDSNEFPVSQYGADRIRRVVLLGTPNLGSIGALRTLIEGYRVGLNSIPPEIVLTFPSTYQVLPHALNNWFVTMDGRPLRRDQFDAGGFWKRFGFSIFNAEVRQRILQGFDDDGEGARYVELLEQYFAKQLERARRFSWSLTLPIAEPRIRYILMGGDCIPTPARAVVEEYGADSELRLAPREIRKPLPGVDYERMMLEPGDGTVTKASLLARQSFDPAIARHEYSFLAVDYPIFLCEAHSQLTGNIDFQNNLLHALLSVDR